MEAGKKFVHFLWKHTSTDNLPARCPNKKKMKLLKMNVNKFSINTNPQYCPKKKKKKNYRTNEKEGVRDSAMPAA